jgi:hypothetical protein
MSIPGFPTDSQQLAESHSLNPAELPGRGLGAQAGVHFYLPAWGHSRSASAAVMIARAQHTGGPVVGLAFGGGAARLRVAPLSQFRIGPRLELPERQHRTIGLVDPPGPG